MSEDLLVTIANERHAPHALQVFLSARHYGHWNGRYLILSAGMNRNQVSIMRRLGISVREYPLPVPSTLWEHAPIEARLPPSSLLKYHLFTSEYRRWNRVVYVDTDVIVRGPLTPLLHVDRFGAVAEPFHLLHDQFDLSGSERVMLSSRCNLYSRSFNFGVFSFKPTALPNDTFDALVALAHEWLPHSRWGEQSIANLHFQNAWEQLPPELNFNPLVVLARGRLRLPPAPIPGNQLPVILHFYGPRKPWHTGNPYQSLWRANLQLLRELHGRGIAGVEASTSLGRSRRLTKLRLLVVVRAYIVIRQIWHVIAKAAWRIIERYPSGRAASM